MILSLAKLCDQTVLFRNVLEYDAVACAAAEGHDNILQYLLSQGQSPNGTCKVVITIAVSLLLPYKCELAYISARA